MSASWHTRSTSGVYSYGPSAVRSGDGSLVSLAGWASAFLTLLFHAWFPVATHAHGADANTADVRLAGDTAYVVVWPPSEVFSRFDDDGDGLIQRSETCAHREAIIELFRNNFSLTDDEGQVGDTIFEDVSTPLANVAADPEAGAEHLRVTLRFRWRKPPAWLSLRYSLVGSRPMLVRSSRVTVTKAIQDQAMLAPPEVTAFDREHPEHRLLAPRVAAEP